MSTDVSVKVQIIRITECSTSRLKAERPSSLLSMRYYPGYIALRHAFSDYERASNYFVMIKCPVLCAEDSGWLIAISAHGSVFIMTKILDLIDKEGKLFETE